MTTYSSDPPPITAGLRTLGTASHQATAGDDPRITRKTTQMATYQTHTNPLKVYFTALATDATTVLVERTQVGVVLVASSYQLYGYSMPTTNFLSDFIAVWDEGDSNATTISWESVGAASGEPPPPPPPSSGNAVASFTVTPGSSTVITVNASASTGDGYAWEIDHVARPETATIITYGPLAVGSHHIKLTVTDSSDNSTAIHEIDYNVAWYALPLGDAQIDTANAIATYPVGLNLAPWTTADQINVVGPWITIGVFNMADTGGGGDGKERLHVYDDNHIYMLNQVGDYEAGGGAGGYRPTFQITEGGYDGISAGHPLGVNDINPTGNIPDGGTSGATRFYRVEYMLPDTNPGGANAPSPYGTGQPWKYQFNFAEQHPGFGASIWRFATENIVNAFRQGVTFQTVINGAQGALQYFDMKTISYNTWYNYVVEYKQSLDGSVGYIRVYRDGVVVTSVPSGTDGAGRYFAVTAATDGSGTLHRLGFNIQNYKGGATYSDQPSNYPDTIVHYRNIRIGPTLASVYP